MKIEAQTPDTGAPLQPEPVSSQEHTSSPRSELAPLIRTSSHYVVDCWGWKGGGGCDGVGGALKGNLAH